MGGAFLFAVARDVRGREGPDLLIEQADFALHEVQLLLLLRHDGVEGFQQVVLEGDPRLEVVQA